MGLKSVNPNGCNAVINNIHPMILFFSKNIENWVNQKMLKFIFDWRIHNCPQTKIPHNFHLINQNGMIQKLLLSYKSREPF